MLRAENRQREFVVVVVGKWAVIRIWERKN